MEEKQEEKQDGKLDGKLDGVRFLNDFWKSFNNAGAYLRAARYMAQESSWEPVHNIVRLAIEELQAASDLVFDAELSEKEDARS